MRRTHRTDSYPSVTLQNPSSECPRRLPACGGLPAHIRPLTHPPPDGQASQAYNFSESGIAWPNEAKKYTNTPSGQPGDFLPPPNWSRRFPSPYTEFPQLANDEHFQVWMRTAALPTFRKLWARNDQETMASGTYNIEVYMSGLPSRPQCVWEQSCSRAGPLADYPVKQFGGTKSIVISTVSWIGGKNSFLGWSYVAAAAVCVLLALAGTVRHMVKPRRMGDMSRGFWSRDVVGRHALMASRGTFAVLSWNQPGAAGK